MSKASIKKITSISKLAIITGKGGSGKSTMMRHLLIDSVSSGDKIPVFIELRSLNQSDQSILDLIKETLISNKFSFDDNYLDKAFKAGHFVFSSTGLTKLVVLSKTQSVSKFKNWQIDTTETGWLYHLG